MNKDLQKQPAKRGPRFYYPDALGSGSEVHLPPEAAHHAARVLRLAVGEPVVLFNGLGGEFEGRITRSDRGEVWVKTGAFLDRNSESPLELILGQGLSSGDRMDLTLQKAVELGISAIQPLATERSVVRLSGERAIRRADHWQSLVVASCEQCGRNRIPAVAELCRLDEWMARLTPDLAGGERRLLMSPLAAQSLKSLPEPTGRIVLLAGPEGGLSPREVALAQDYGFTPVRLGPRVLRTETAALAALAAIQALWGDF
jgi:16S rRNA (uracil1498-N3)-methyltransferase